MINLSGRLGKFYANDWFGETIIKLKKEKIRPSANAKSDEFLREVVAPNVFTLWKSKEVIAQATGATSHGSYYLVVDSFKDVLFIVKLLLIEDVFLENQVVDLAIMVNLQVWTFLLLDVLLLPAEFYYIDISGEQEVTGMQQQRLKKMAIHYLKMTLMILWGAVLELLLKVITTSSIKPLTNANNSWPTTLLFCALGGVGLCALDESKLYTRPSHRRSGIDWK